MERENFMRRLLENNRLCRENLKANPELRYLFFEVTDRCNLSCLHCGSSCTAQNFNQLAPEDIIKTLTSVKNNLPTDKMLLCVTGGEPLLYPHLISTMKKRQEMGFAWGMTTNATLIDDEKAKQLFSRGLVSVTVSLDGMKDDHDWLRNSPGGFEKAISGINALKRNAPPGARVDVLSVINRRNFDKLEEIYSLVRSLGVDSWRAVNCEPIGRALENDSLMLSPQQLKGLFEFIQRKHFTSSIDVDYGCSHYLTPKYENMLRPYLFTCMAGTAVASVARNGDIVACLDIERRPELVQGNIATHDFRQVWQEKYRFFRSDRTAHSEKCASCPDRSLCAGDSAHTWDYDANTPMLCVKEYLNI